MQYIKLECRDKVAIVTIDRPEALNAINSQVLAELEETFTNMDSNEIRCVIITGAGSKAFVAGADIAEMSEMNPDQARAYAARGLTVFDLIENFPAPVIAAVNGYALGGGCELTLACDLRLAAENAVFGQPEVSLGVCAGFGATQRLSRLIGIAKAKELLFTGGRIKAQKALECGLVNCVYAAEELMEQALKLANKIAANAPVAVRATKQAINEGVFTDIDTAYNIETELFAACFATMDQKNAMRAFVQKRLAEPFMNK